MSTGYADKIRPVHPLDVRMYSAYVLAMPTEPETARALCPRCKFQFDPTQTLTPRQVSVARLLEEGRSQAVIADRLGISRQRVHQIVASLRKREEASA